jgi:glutaminase
LSKDLELHFMHVSRAARSAVRASYHVVDAPSRRRRSPQEQAVLLQYGRRAKVYELHGDLLFAGAESVIREVTQRADDLDVLVMDIRGVDETSAASRRLLVGLRDELRKSGCQQLMVDPTQTVLELDSDVSKRVEHFPDVNAAIERAEDALIAKYGGAEVRPRSITVDEHPLLAGLLADEMAILRARLVPRSYTDGDVVVSEGGGPEGLFLVLSGMIDVHIDRAGVRHHLSMFTVGTTFGVVYAVAQREYDIDAHAKGAVEALLLPVAALAELSRISPDLMLALLRRLVSGAFDSLDWVTRTLVTPN